MKNYKNITLEINICIKVYFCIQIVEQLHKQWHLKVLLVNQGWTLLAPTVSLLNLVSHRKIFASVNCACNDFG